jgi:hypothetical protein
VIVAAAVIPHPPLLLPGVTGTPVPEVEELRRAASQAIRWALRFTGSAVAVGGAERTGAWPNLEAMRSGYVGEPEPGDRLPLSLSVVRALLDPGVHVDFRSIAADAAPHAAAELGRHLAEAGSPTALIVAGDGSARRGPKAPGYEDPRAIAFDGAVGAALAAADTRALADLDPELSSELMASGRAAFQVLAAACAGTAWTADVDYVGDPFGVSYVVARWSPG